MESGRRRRILVTAGILAVFVLAVFGLAIMHVPLELASGR